VNAWSPQAGTPGSTDITVSAAISPLASWTAASEYLRMPDRAT
jgi:hypothetical protein